MINCSCPLCKYSRNLTKKEKRDKARAWRRFRKMMEKT